MTFKAFLILIGLIAAASYAQEGTLEQAVANSIDGLLSDTVNEGEMNVHTKRIRKKPVMTCTVSPARNYPNTELAKCDVTFSVEVTSGEPTKCEASCFLMYKISNKDISKLEPVSVLEDKCIENLGSTEC